MKFHKLLIAFGLAALVAACGGGGGNASAPPPAPDPTLVKNVSDVVFILDKTTITNTGNDKAVLTVTVLDEKRNALAGVPVSVTLDVGIYTPATIITDAVGQVSGVIAIGRDTAVSTISATITAAGKTSTGATTSVSKLASIKVKGNTLSAVFAQASVSKGKSATLDVTTVDGAGNPISGVVVTLTGIPGVTQSVTTSSTGAASAVFNSPAVAGNYSVSASATGFLPANASLTVTDPVAVVIPKDAVGTPTSSSLSPITSSIGPIGSQPFDRTYLYAKFIDAANNGIENMRVVFFIAGNPLGNGENLLPPSADGTVTRSDVQYTNSSGIARAQYVAGTRTSPTNGVKLQACFKNTDFDVAADFTAGGYCSIATHLVQATLTVASVPLSISIGDNNVLLTSGDGVGYLKKFLIQVNDSSGVALPDAVVSLSIDITHYGKGRVSYYALVNPNVYPVVAPPTKLDGSIVPSCSTSGTPAVTTCVVVTDPVDPVTGYVVDNPTTISTSPPVGFNIWCANEDKNRNGFLDASEDRNFNGTLEPRKADIIVAYVNGSKTDAKGQLLAQVTYPQSVGGWLAYTIRATTSVNGSEGDASRSFITSVLEADQKNGSFLTPPYGSNACNARN